MAESQDVNTLRRRGRRRLVGAIALVLLAAIVLPMVFDPEPKSSSPPLSVRIPGEDDAAFAPKATPKLQAPQSVPAPETAPTPGKTEAKAAEPALAAEAQKPFPKAAATPPPTTPASVSQPPAAEQFVVPVAALASQAKLKQLIGKLKQARLPYYTEPLATAKGTVTRVRVGPYATREAAEEAQRQLKHLDLNPGKVLGKS